VLIAVLDALFAAFVVRLKQIYAFRLFTVGCVRLNHVLKRTKNVELQKSLKRWFKT